MTQMSPPHDYELEASNDRALKQRSKALATDAVGELLDRANEVGSRTMTTGMAMSSRRLPRSTRGLS